MTRYLKTAIIAGLTVASVGCTNFLSGDKLSSDPNRPTTAAASDLFTSVQVNSYYIVNGGAARVLTMWAQQMAGTDRQYQGYDVYSVTEGTLGGEFASAYTGGGLIDMHSIIDQANAGGNKDLSGITRVWEALGMSFVADNYGDAPYSEAVSSVIHPKLDKQLDIYAALQMVLDSAITDLSGATADQVGNLDLSLGGDPAAWTKVAHTLKARLYLHTAEVDPTAYASALAEAQQGIDDPSGDLDEYHSSASLEENIWWQFIARDRDTYMRPGAFLVNLMVARNDPRVPDYFALNGNGTYGGATPGEGLDPQTMSNISDTRLRPDFLQPIITWMENESIIAEAAYRTNNLTLARSTLDAIRASYGASAIGAGLSGTALLTAILDEKYIGLFQNYEVMNDYKRNCYPNLTAASQAFGGDIPARLTYPIAERTANPNIPTPSAQPARNQNDPVTTTSADGTACKAQK